MSLSPHSVPAARLARRPAASLAASMLAAGWLAACTATGSPTPGPSQPPASAEPSASQGAPASAGPSASAAASADADGVIVTFLVADAEEYRVRLTDPADIEFARRLLSGEVSYAIPNGLVVRGDDGGVNTGWSWHIDPDSMEFAEVSIEVCDGLPSDVEADAISGERYCPWSAEVIDIEE